jgi:aryl-alcohol dehydrogenase
MLSVKVTAAVVAEKNAPFFIKDDVELAPLQSDDLQIHIVATGICHSDEAIRKGDAVIGYPIVLGHEGSGIVEKVGPEVKNFQPGDHVVLSFYGCGSCINCLQGKPTQCLNYVANNLSGVRPDGSAHFTEKSEPLKDMFDQSSFATTTVVRERNAVKVPKNLDLRKLGPLGCGYVTGSGTIFNVLKPQPGQTIAVFGTGAVGLAAMMAGRISGCTRVIAIDIVDSRLKLAQELGATDTINSKTENPVEKIKSLTDGHGVNFAVDTTGLTQVMQSSIQALAQGGTSATIAVTPHHIDVDTWNDLCTHDRKIVGVNMGDSIPQVDVPRLIRFYQLGLFDFDKTEKFYPFAQINEANADSISGKTIKPILIIDPNYKPGN